MVMAPWNNAWLFYCNETLMRRLNDAAIAGIVRALRPKTQFRTAEGVRTRVGINHPVALLVRRRVTQLRCLSTYWRAVIDFDAERRGLLLSVEKWYTVNEVRRLLGPEATSRIALKACNQPPSSISDIVNLLIERRVRSFALVQTSLPDGGAALIAGALPASGVRCLNLCSVNIGTAGAFALAEVLPHTSLCYLNVSPSNIGDEGIIAIARALLASPSMRHCDLGVLSVDSECAAAFNDVLEMWGSPKRYEHILIDVFGAQGGAESQHVVLKRPRL